MQQLWRKSDAFFRSAQSQPLMPSIVDTMPSPETLTDWTSKIDACVQNHQVTDWTSKIDARAQNQTGLLDSLIAMFSRASFAVIYALLVSYAMRKHAFLKSSDNKVKRKKKKETNNNNKASLDLVQIAKTIQHERAFMTALRRGSGSGAGGGVGTRTKYKEVATSYSVQFIFPTCMAQWLENEEIAAPCAKLISAWGLLCSHRRTLVQRLLNHALALHVLQNKARSKATTAERSTNTNCWTQCDLDKHLVQRMQWQSLYRKTQHHLSNLLQETLGLSSNADETSFLLGVQQEKPLSMREWSNLMLGKGPGV